MSASPSHRTEIAIPSLQRSKKTIIITLDEDGMFM